MEDKELIIVGTLMSIICTVLAIIFAIKLFQVNLFCAIIGIILCASMGYFDALVIRYFVNKFKQKKNERKN